MSIYFYKGVRTCIEKIISVFQYACVLAFVLFCLVVGFLCFMGAFCLVVLFYFILFYYYYFFIIIIIIIIYLFIYFFFFFFFGGGVIVSFYFGCLVFLSKLYKSAILVGLRRNANVFYSLLYHYFTSRFVSYTECEISCECQCSCALWNQMCPLLDDCCLICSSAITHHQSFYHFAFVSSETFVCWCVTDKKKIVANKITEESSKSEKFVPIFGSAASAKETQYEKGGNRMCARHERKATSTRRDKTGTARHDRHTLGNRSQPICCPVAIILII